MLANVSFTTGEQVSIRVGKGGSKVKYNSIDDVGFAAGNGGNTYFGEFTAKGGDGAKNIASDYTNEVVDGVSCPFGENIAFKDIEQHWAKKEINLLIEESVIDGYEDGTFKPDNYITVREFLKILIEKKMITTKGI